ncbi:MAG: hypothetical protein JW850_14765 [Thermoflexales bacterium]|nr:hypothetical protein [Thermoflexales bacterium]
MVRPSIFTRAGGWGAVGAISAFWLLLMGPLAQAGRMTCSHDGALYLLRAFQLDEMVARGVLWPRWVPGMVFGYGYPLFNFHPLLSLYPVVILHRLGLSLLHSWNLALGLSLLASGLAAFVWARQVLGPRGAFVAAIAYMAAPYQLYDVYWRGNLAESLSLPLLPLALWAVLSVARRAEWRTLGLGGVIYAALLLTHPATSLIATPFLAAYGLLLWGESGWSRRTLLRLGGTGVVGVGLAAFFLLPAYMEQSHVQMWRAVASGADYRHFFVSTGELFDPGQASDPLLINPSPPRSLGLAAGLLAGLGLAASWRRRAALGPTHSRHALWAGLSLAMAMVMLLDISEPLWENVPLLSFVQFPWRFLSMGSLLAAWLAGAGAAALTIPPLDSRQSGPRMSWLGHALVVGVCALALVIGASPWAYPHACAALDEHTQASYVAYERSVGLVGTTAFGEYLPAAVQAFPTTSPLVEAVSNGQPVNRWLAPGARSLQAHDDGLHASLELESDAPLTVTYHAFYFPGWQARVDGRLAAIHVVSPTGTMYLDVAAGRHTLEMTFGSTPLRTAAQLLSLLVAVGVAVLWICETRLGRKWLGRPSSPPRVGGVRGGGYDASSIKLAHSPPAQAHLGLQPSPWPVWLGLGLLGVILLALKLGVVDRYDTPLRWRRWQDSQFKAAQHTLQASVEGRAHLLGFDVHPQPVQAGQVLFANLYWSLSDELKFRATLRLLDRDGLVWSDKAEQDAALVRYTQPPPSHEWPIGAYAKAYHAIRSLPGTPPGDYLLVAVPFKPGSLEPLHVTEGQSAPGAYPGLVLGQVRISRPPSPPAPETMGLGTRLLAPLGDELALVGYSQDRSQASPGEGMLVTLGWQAQRKPSTDYILRLSLMGPDGEQIGRWERALGGDYPSSKWIAGEVLLSQLLLAVPGRAGSGEHTWSLELLDQALAPLGQVALGKLAVTAPERVFTSPALPQPVHIQLGEWVELAGGEWPAQAVAGQAASITLVWQALGETERGYKAFVHMLAANGQVAAQSDAVPAAWTRPTPGWRVGEFVSDVHMLTLKRALPPGKYRLVAGLYDADDGQRLATADGENGIALGVLEVVAP